jgi:hypothetical protein
LNEAHTPSANQVERDDDQNTTKLARCQFFSLL